MTRRHQRRDEETAGMPVSELSSKSAARCFSEGSGPISKARHFMNRRDFVISTFACAVGLSTRSSIIGQTGAAEPDLAALAGDKRLQVFNRTASSLTDGVKKGVHLSEAAGNGVAYVPGSELANGVIECDIRGKDVLQQSFVGVAFHGVDGTTYDAIYFRPFNFRAEDPVRRSHAVQYVSLPTDDWQKLRTEQPDKYEHAVSPAPDPNGWFRARIVVASPKVTVFVGEAKEPVLVVDQLSSRKKGLVGLWVGNNSSGDFAGLRLVPA
jgi:hypothetical protein